MELIKPRVSAGRENVSTNNGDIMAFAPASMREKKYAAPNGMKRRPKSGVKYMFSLSFIVIISSTRILRLNYYSRIGFQSEYADRSDSA